MTTADTSYKSIRMVFDGAPLAGKTTAACALGHAIGAKMAPPIGDMVACITWFDDAAPESDRPHGPIQVELKALPRERLLNERRRHLLHTGDVVVFIADSSAAGFSETVRQVRALRADLTRLGGHPIVFVANKRDVDDALPLDVMRSRLDLADDETLIECVATTGVGLRRVFVAAMRVALRNRRSGTSPAARSAAHRLSRLGSGPGPATRAGDPLVVEGASLRPAGLPEGKAVVLDRKAWRMLNRIADADGDAVFEPRDRAAVLGLLHNHLIDGRVATSAAVLEEQRRLTKEVIARAVSKSVASHERRTQAVSNAGAHQECTSAAAASHGRRSPAAASMTSHECRTRATTKTHQIDPISMLPVRGTSPS